ncbi:(2Fe-2S)-binding protein, partial [Brevibacillus agri]
MGLIPKDQLRQLIKEHNLQTMEDVQKALKDIFAETLQ